MNIDRVAAAMTGGWRGPAALWRGRLGPAFTARVMATIEGRPQPGFTARVMEGVAQGTPVAQGFSPANRALLLLPAALALAVGIAALQASRTTLPDAPAAPRLATGAFASHPPAPSWQAAVRQPQPGSDRASRPPVVTLALPEPAPPAIYMIAALEGPEDIAMKPIDPATRTIPALDAPAPLTVPDLAGTAGGSQKLKEQP